MNQIKINELEETISRDYGNIAGIIVQKNGVRLYDGYFNGYNAETAFHVFSVTKSVISILIGVAIDKGLIKSIDQKVLDFFPDYTPIRGEKTALKVTLKDMLTMTAPFKNTAPYTKYFTSESWVKSALDLLGGKGEIGRFKYTPLLGPDIFSGIITSVTGQSALEFANENLFTQLGIDVKGNVVFHSKEEQLSIMKDHHESGWVADPKGINTAGWGLFITPEDMVKIGQLYLNGGVWDGRRIVSEEWIDESTKQHSLCEEWGNLAYGYLWWVIDENEHSFAAMGDGGNVIYINAKRNMVVAIASLFMPRAKDRIAFIKDYIEPLFN